MSKEKQIEEMARTLCGEKENRCEDCDSNVLCEFWVEASTLHNAGYRKQIAWISVEDRLPETYGDVICYTRCGYVSQLVYNPQYKLFNVSDDNVECAIAVTHWMPLSEPPKGE